MRCRNPPPAFLPEYFPELNPYMPKTKKKTPVKKAVVRRKSSRRSVGATSGQGVTQFLSSLFEANELIPESQARNRKMTDEQIAEMMKREFPGRGTGIITGKVTINEYRIRYNKGHFSRMIPPEKMSFRRGKFGRIVDARSGKHFLLPEEIAKMQAEYEANRKKIVARMMQGK
jgi:hypothetical protein